MGSSPIPGTATRRVAWSCLSVEESGTRSLVLRFELGLEPDVGDREANDSLTQQRSVAAGVKYYPAYKIGADRVKFVPQLGHGCSVGGSSHCGCFDFDRKDSSV